MPLSRYIFTTFAAYFSIFPVVISNISIERTDISRRIIDIQRTIPNLRHVRQTPSQHYRHQPGLFNLRSQYDDADNWQTPVDFIIWLKNYTNDKLKLPNNQTCTCPEPSTKNCPYLTNIGSPCFFSFTVIVNTARGVYYDSTAFVPFNKSLSASDNTDFSKKLSFMNLEILPTSIDVFVYQLGPVINRSTWQAIYVDHLSLVDHFHYPINKQSFGDNGLKNLSRPSKTYEMISIVGDVTSTKLILSMSYYCNSADVYGPHCEMRCNEQVKNNSLIPYDDSVTSFVCKSILEREVTYYCVKDSEVKGNNDLLTNCQQCIYMYNNATCGDICVPVKLLRQPIEIIDNSNWWYYIFFLIFLILFLIALIAVVLLLIHILRDRRQNQVYGDKENFFSATGSGDGGSAGGVSKRAGRHFTIDHELPPNAVKRGLSPPRSPFYETSSSDSTASERVSSTGAISGGVVRAAPLSADHADYNYAAPPDRREALV